MAPLAKWRMSFSSGATPMWICFGAVVVHPKFGQSRHELNQVEAASVKPSRVVASGISCPPRATRERTRAM